MTTATQTASSAPRKPRKEPQPMTRALAASKIGKILEQLPTAADRHTVIDFLDDRPRD